MSDRLSPCCGAEVNEDRAPFCTRCGEPQPHEDREPSDRSLEEYQRDKAAGYYRHILGDGTGRES